ncbi:hypothetical protein B484DRAFT_388928, partial [Ochromonadaceae sp. CCMP2298]
MAWNTARMSDRYEEEMIRLASEISLMDDNDLEWDPDRLDDVVDKVKYFEEILDEHIFAGDINQPVDLLSKDQPMTDAQLYELFGSKRVPDESIPRPGYSPTDSIGFPYQRDSSDLSGQKSSGGSSWGVTEQRGPVPVSEAAPRSVSAKSRETVAGIRGKLKWFQQKV